MFSDRITSAEVSQDRRAEIKMRRNEQQDESVRDWLARNHASRRIGFILGRAAIVPHAGRAGLTDWRLRVH